MTTFMAFVMVVTLTVLGSQGAAAAPPTPHAGGVGVGLSLDVETLSAKQIGGNFVYSVKFLCGRVPGGGTVDLAESPQDTFPLSPGFYATEINVYNPHGAGVTLTVKGVLTFAEPRSVPPGLTIFPAGPPTGGLLGANEAFMLDCFFPIRNLVGIPGSLSPFLTGFISITSPVELDVVAVRTVKSVRCLVSGKAGVKPCI